MDDDWLGGPTPGAPAPPTSLSALAQVVEEQRGLVTRRQCLTAGMSSRAVEMRLESGRWVRAQRGVYLTTPGRDDWRTRALAAHLACGPHAAWSHSTAAHVWGLTQRPPGTIELLVPHVSTARAPTGAILRRSRHLDDRVDPMRWPWLTTVEETLLDIADTGTADETFAVLGRAFQRGLTVEAVVLGRLAHRARHGRRAFLAEVLGDVGAGAQSAMEVRYLRDVERAHHLPRGVRQTSTSLDRTAVHDVAYPALKVIVELDGRLGHTWTGDQVRDGVRDRRSAGDGWLTVRAYWPDVAVTPCRLALDLEPVLQTRGWHEKVGACRRRDCVIRDRVALTPS